MNLSMGTSIDALSGLHASCLCSSCLFFLLLPSCLFPGKEKERKTSWCCRLSADTLDCVPPALKPRQTAPFPRRFLLSPFSIPHFHSPFPFPQFPGTVRTQDRDTGSISEDSQSQYLASCDASSDAKPATIKHQLNLGYTVYLRRCRDGPALSASGLATGIFWFCPWQIYFWRLCRRRGQLEAGHG